MNKNKGITLVALVVTIIVLIILAGVSINLILGQYGIVNRATSGAETYSEKQAKEKLELELSNMYIEKNTNINYNEDDYLTTKLSEKGFSVNGNIVIVDGYQFQIDRSVPKIMNSLGKGTENNEIILITNSNLEADYTKSTIKIEITYEGTLKEVNLNGESLTIPEAQDGKYVIEKEVEKNGNYNVFVKDSSDGYKIANVEVKDISEDIEINNEEALVKLAERVNAGATYEGRTVTLTRNLDLSSVCGADKGKNWTPIGTETNPFKGNFNGNNKTISNLYINNSSNYQGLFGSTTGNLKNVILEDPNLTGVIRSGALVGISYGDVSNIKVIKKESSTITGTSYVGCIVGVKKNGTISNCENHVTLTITGISAGGIAGYGENLTIRDCSNYGNISSKGQAGGIIGIGTGVSGGGTGSILIERCFNKVTITTGSGDDAGGIIGMLKVRGTIQNCYNRGNVSGNRQIGGIAGDTYMYNNSKEKYIKNCYNTGTFTAPNGRAGSIVGQTQYTYVSNCIWTSGNAGLANNAGGSSITTSGKVTGDVLMTSSSRLSDECFTADIFDTKTNTYKYNDGYPILKWQIEQ